MDRKRIAEYIRRESTVASVQSTRDIREDSNWVGRNDTKPNEPSASLDKRSTWFRIKHPSRDVELEKPPRPSLPCLPALQKWSGRRWDPTVGRLKRDFPLLLLKCIKKESWSTFVQSKFRFSHISPVTKRRTEIRYPRQYRMIKRIIHLTSSQIV